MFHKLIAILLIGVLLLQSSREVLIGLWFRANREWVAEQYCVNKDEPLLMCQGKCHLQKVIEMEAPEDSPVPAKMPAPEERMPFHALPAPRPPKADFLTLRSVKRTNFFYLAPYSVELAFAVFRPPWV